LERAFLQLTVEQRAALVLTHYVGLSPGEVAQILGIPVGTVYSRVHYGSRAMRVVIAGSPETPSPSPEPGR
jgi:RNA polymerase sigma-70 factor (ECF subfamily)